VRRDGRRPRRALRVALLQGLPCLVGLAAVASAEAGADGCLGTASTGTAEAARPRIGLVLGGGGARGAAHVGVIQRLEELRVPVDVIAGTSMGALVGALHATGLTGKELEAVLGSLDWNDLFDDRTARLQRPFRRKRDDDLNLFGPKLGIEQDGLQLPRGAIGGQKVGLLFESLINERTRRRDFTELPIPFKAVAADLVSGEAVVLAEGNLARAMRASMSVPGLFDPVPQGERLLVDGGIANNLPADVARAMGADRLIVVDASSPLATRQEVDDVLGVIDQLTNLLIQQSVQRQVASLGPGDVLIRPELGRRVGSTDFELSATAVAIGYAAAVASEDLEALSLDEAAYHRYRTRLQPCPPGTPRIDFVELDNRSRFDDEVIRALLDVPLGQPLDRQQLEDGIRQVYATGFLDEVSYELVDRGGVTGLRVDVRQDDRGTQFLEWGLDFNGGGATSELSLRAGLLKTDLDSYGAELRVLAQAGDRPGALVELYKPLEPRQRWIVVGQGYGIRGNLYRYDDDGRALAIFEEDRLVAAARLERNIGRHAAVSAGVAYGWGSIGIEVGDPATAGLDYDDVQLRLSAQYDRLDDLYFPGRGSLLAASLVEAQSALGSDQGYRQLLATGVVARTRGRHSLLALARYQTTLDGQAPIYAAFRAGGFARLSGYNPRELIGSHFAMALTGYRYEFGRTGLLPAYLGFTLEAGNVAERRSELSDDLRGTGSLYLGYDSPLGPLYFGYAGAEDGRHRLFLRIGTVLAPSVLDQ